MRRAEHERTPPSSNHSSASLVWLLALAASAMLLSRRPARRDEPVSEADTPLQKADLHGRDAEKPHEIPPRGWADILIRTYEEFLNDRLMLVAAGLTFYVLLAIFPAISALVSIYGLFADPGTVAEHLQLLSGVVPAGGLDILRETLMQLTEQGRAGLSLGLILGLGIALWSTNSGMKTLIDALNIVYGEREKRSFVKLTLISLGFTLFMLIFMVTALAAVVILPTLLNFVGLGGLENWLLTLRWPIVLVLVAGLTALVFRYGPSRERARWRWVTWGAGLASVLWVGISILFSWYVENFASYDETYGSLGAAIGFMTWIWISAIVILLGAELNAELEHQTSRDTTTPPEKPIGERGAVMADTVGETRG
ncbi:YihY/virulence factor BrkB family protein [Limoniibacter endophyticus]|uniref:YihY/virulence factor BrkB family protein n=1 Tax=Limoniibacter endophyticus TaxID=1565040 RepID=A0A8J3GHF6_9HYPH|nr:YihY/virulence factor BrkB family protein [Limoniibacter endophyticus]GHC71658.1 hypothetical protein GCM10010136_19070 [Limoniibacter endophyticus]